MSSQSLQSYGELVHEDAAADRGWPLSKIVFATVITLAFASLAWCYAYTVYMHILYSKV